MSKQDYENKINKYLKKVGDKDVIDVDAVLKDKGEHLLDDEVPVTDREMLGFSIKVNKKRYTVFPDRLPTDGVLPRPPDEHSRLGLYESKRDLYLITAHAYNILMEKLETLESEVANLKTKIGE